MKIPSHILGVLAAGCLISSFLAGSASAAITDDQFNQLKDIVTQQGQKIQNQDQRIDQLEKIHEQDQTNHAQDQQKIQDLEKQLDETHSIATNAEQTAAAAQVQASAPAAQAGPPASHLFSMVGDAEVQFGKTGSAPNTFALADFAPIFLFRARDNILFEAGFDVILQNGTQTSGGGSSTSVNMSFGTLDYLVNDYVTLEAGDMLLPLGTYSERGAGWLNKIPDDPLPRQLLPGSGVGAQLRGALPLCENGSTLTYSVYGANGPSSTDGTGNAGSLDLGGNVGDTPNWHGSPSGGARLGIFYPWKAHYDLELGVSGQSGEWDNAGTHLWSAVVLDAALHVSPYFELKGEYITTRFGSDDLGLVRQCGWWTQAGYKLAGLDLDAPIVNDLELVGRYDTFDDGLGTRNERYTAGFVYYLSNTLLFESDFENLQSTQSGTPHNGYVMQLSYGF